jgi:two-component system, chemotaxis family, CheB/CheR fusion protein
VALINQPARLVFSLSAKDVGRRLQDLEISYRPTELRSMIEQAYAERRAVTRPGVERRFQDGDTHYFDVVVQPLADEAQSALGVAITFVDATRSRKLEQELQRSREEIQTANEELQSSNEELETTNEELQSSNEELETMNEELQSTNDVLETMNDEQANRSLALDRANLFLEGILGSMGVGVVVLDREQCVQVWNANSTDLWGLRPEEVEGRHILSLDIGFPVESLKEPLRTMLNGDQEQSEYQVEAVTRRGRTVSCRVRIMPLRTQADELHGVILLMAADGQTMMLPAQDVS